MDFDKLFKEYCLKQNPSETVSGGCAMFVLGFVDFLKEQAVEHGVEPTVTGRAGLPVTYSEWLRSLPA